MEGTLDSQPSPEGAEDAVRLHDPELFTFVKSAKFTTCTTTVMRKLLWHSSGKKCMPRWL